MHLLGRLTARGILSANAASQGARAERDSSVLDSPGKECEGLGPARAVVYGVALGSLIWAGIIVLLVQLKPEQITFPLSQ